MNHNKIAASVTPGTKTARPLEVRIGIGLFIAAMAVFIAKAPPYAIPGRWAGIAANFAGLDPFQNFMRPLWTLLVRLLALFPVDIGLLLNLTTALCGAGVCWLMYDGVRRIPFSRFFGRKDREAVERVPRMMAGLFAGLFALTAMPLMMLAPRGDYVVFDIFLLLLSFYPAFRYAAAPRPGLLYLSCFLYGLGISEYPVMLALSPAFVLWWTILIWKVTPRPKVWSMVLAAALLAAGASAVLIYAGIMSGGRTAALKGIDGTGMVLLEFARLYYMELTRSIPKVGWLLILGVNIVPFFFVVLRPLQEPEDVYTAAGVYPFRFILFALGVITLFDLPGSPSHLVGPGVLLVVPYVVVAAWFGHLLGYYYGLSTRFRKAWPPRAFAAVWLAVFLAAGIRHAAVARIGHLEPIVRYAEEVIRNLEGRDFLLTDGSMDASLRLSAARQDVPARIVNYYAASSPEYGRHLASLFVDLGLQNAAHLGIRPLLSEWINRGIGATGRLALLAEPDIAALPGIRVVPGGLYYRLYREGTLPTAPELADRVESSLDMVALPDLDAMEPGDAGYYQGQFMTRFLSRMANDAGVFVDDAGDAARARALYGRSLEVWPDNFSASMNLLAAERRDQSGEEEKWLQVLKDQIARNPGLFSIGFVNKVCGVVRDPMTSFHDGSMLVQYGLIQPAMERAERSASLVSEEDIASRIALANLFMRGRRVAESEEILNAILEREPGNLNAVFGLYQAALMRDDLDAAEGLLTRLADMGMAADKVRIEQANLAFKRGNHDRAREIFLEVVRDPAAPVEAWYSLALVAAALEDRALVDRAMLKLEQEQNYPPGLMLLAERALQRDQYEKARRYLSRVRALEPSNFAALERLVVLDYQERNAGLLRTHSAEVLALDPGHAFANFAAANLHMLDNRPDLAEAALRRSLERSELALARNDLAWMLRVGGKLDEALEHARRAVEMEPKDGNFRHTLAMILFEQHAFAEAQREIETSVELSKGQVASILLHAAQIHHAAGHREKAQDAFGALDLVLDQLSETDRADAEALKRLIF